jgi:hypothetical protein
MTMDTYANLLYKQGRRSEAISWEKKAIELLQNEVHFVDYRKDFESTIEKMKRGVPTWKPGSTIF